MGQISRSAVRRQIITLIPALLNTFFTGCSIGWMGNTIYFFSVGEEVTATADEISIMASCVQMGKLVFAIPSGLLTDKYGRRKIMICAALTHFFSWLLLSLYTSVVLIYITQLLSGIATAMVETTSLIYIGEIVSSEIRGRFFGLYAVILLIGAMIPSFIAAIFPSYYVLTYSEAVISFICLIPSFWTMETPNYLISMLKYKQAERNLKRVRPGYTDEDIDHEFAEIKNYIDEEKTRKRQLSWFMFFKSKSISKPLGIIAILNFVTMSTGFVVLSTYITVINPENGYISNRYYPIIMRITLILPLVGTTFYMEKFSRRSIFITGAALNGIICGLCALFNFYYVNAEKDFCKWLLLLGNFSIYFIFYGSLNPMKSALNAELLPQCVKGIGGSMIVMVNALSIVISFQLYNFITYNFSLYYLYVTFFFYSLVLCLLVYFLLPEGRGKSLADIQNQFIIKSSMKTENDNLL